MKENLFKFHIKFHGNRFNRFRPKITNVKKTDIKIKIESTFEHNGI